MTLPSVTGYLAYVDETNRPYISYPENWNTEQRQETSKVTITAFVDPRF